MSRKNLARWLTLGVTAPALMACGTVGADHAGRPLAFGSNAEALQREPGDRRNRVAQPRPVAGTEEQRVAHRETRVAQPRSGGSTEKPRVAPRDAEIAELRRRIEELERGASPQIITRRASAPRDPDAAPPSMVVAQASGSEAGEAAGQTAAPGSFEVEQEEAERALERTLVATGALLLPFGQMEVEPSFSYTRRVVDTPVFVTEGGLTFIGEEKLRRNEFEAGLGLRLGLPLDAQLELDLPYRLVDQSKVTTIGGNERGEVDDTGHGMGDVRVGLAKTLVREQGWVPDVIARVSYDADNGKTSDKGVVLGGGFQELSGSLSFTKRQDPLAFIGQAAYEYTFEDDDVQPGAQITFSIGTVLAASPETSLRLVLTQQFVDDVEVDGNNIDGSDQVISTLSIGASAILGKGVLLDGALDVGLTDDGPDYAVRVALPIRFDLPIPGT